MQLCASSDAYAHLGDHYAEEDPKGRDNATVFTTCEIRSASGLVSTGSNLALGAVGFHLGWCKAGEAGEAGQASRCLQ